MKHQVVQFDQQAEHIEAFLSLPAKLYKANELTQNRSDEEALLLGRHPLSNYFKLVPFLVYEGKNPVARVALTIHEGDSTCFIGFFEGFNNPVAVKALFKAADKYAKAAGCTKIVGPVNGSFWMTYRLKTNHFDLPPYFGEPYNKLYYLDLFQQSGYSITHEYISNYYKRSIKLSELAKYNQRYRRSKKKNYKIISPKRHQKVEALSQVYELFTALYSGFPAYKKISKDDFLTYFDRLWPLIDLSVFKIAYYKGQPVGFLVGFPDFGNLLARRPSRYVKIRLALKKIRSRRYVMLYMGVLDEHRGLGRALVRATIAGGLWKNSTYIGALIAKNKATESYSKDSVAKQSSYALLEKRL
ncbi:MAG: hypothetical protein R3313_02155 [Candidatus Saccharimonadales bacterium]|nr:hypothetical protein [Candidatus Saccharimonadales bacterium]